MTTLGVLGGGQLGQMLARAGRPLDVKVVCFDPKPEACAGREAPLTVGRFDDLDAVGTFAALCDFITIEFESVPVRTLEALLESGVRVLPEPRSLRIAQDRIAEKRLFESIGLGVPSYAAVDSLEALQRASGAVGLPAVLKTRRDGYDGKGQRVIRDPGELVSAWNQVGEHARGGCILEAMVRFKRELSVVTARDHLGTIRSFASTENVHRDCILHRSVAPANGADAARAHAERLVTQLGHVGVLALELFETNEGVLMGNEMAPRVHNSGHWTLDAGNTDQFSQHVRAVTGGALAEPQLEGGAAMVNLIGELPPARALAEPGLRVHLYGKSPRAGRKLGHVCWSCEDAQQAERRAREWAARWIRGCAEPLPENAGDRT